MSNSQILKAWAVSTWVPVDLTEALTELQVSHTIVGWSTEEHRLRARDIDGLAAEQPAWPVIAHSVSDIPRIRINRERQILFVCDSAPALANVNLTPLPEARTLRQSLVLALRQLGGNWELVSTEPDIQDYVALASKPSFLNQLQTAIYKINPYADRKIIQQKIIYFLGGKLSINAMREILRSSYKYEPIRELLNLPEAVVLSNAVARARAGEDSEEVAEELGIEPFDISYILSSVNKQQDGKV